MDKNESRTARRKTSTSYTAVKLEADLPRAALREYSRYLHNALDENIEMHGPFGAICLLSEDVTGKDLAFPVIAGLTGTFALPTMEMLERGLDRYILLGFCDLSADEKRVTNPVPLPGWGEHSEYVKEMMRHALVTAN